MDSTSTVLQGVGPQIKDMLDDFMAQGPGYARAYAEYMVGARPKPPCARFNQYMAKAIRETVMDESVRVGAGLPQRLR